MKSDDLDRNEDLAKKEGVKDHLLKLYQDVEKGYDEQWERSSKLQATGATTGAGDGVRASRGRCHGGRDVCLARWSHA